MITGTDPVNEMFYLSLGGLGCIVFIVVVVYALIFVGVPRLIKSYRTLKLKRKMKD